MQLLTEFSVKTNQTNPQNTIWSMQWRVLTIQVVLALPPVQYKTGLFWINLGGNLPVSLIIRTQDFFFNSHITTGGHMQCKLGKAYWSPPVPGKLCCVSVHTACFVFTRGKRPDLKNLSTATELIHSLQPQVEILFSPIICTFCSYPFCLFSAPMGWETFADIFSFFNLKFCSISS